MDPDASLQERYFAEGICFGCGPSNPKGLHLRSFASGDELTAEWMPEEHHQAFPGILNGGIIGSLIDCQSNWTALYTLMQRHGAFAMTVTAEFKVRLLRPTPIDRPVQLSSRATRSDDRRVWVAAELRSGEDVTAEGEGLFILPKVPVISH